MGSGLKYRKDVGDVEFSACPFYKCERIRRHGRSGRRHECFLYTGCGKTFSSTYGTIVYRVILTKHLADYLKLEERRLNQLDEKPSDRWRANLRRYLCKSSYSNRKAIFKN